MDGKMIRSLKLEHEAFTKTTKIIHDKIINKEKDDSKILKEIEKVVFEALENMKMEEL